ncbi:MAG: polysaccharide biosynthesis/export family protein [Aeoliella sp.]
MSHVIQCQLLGCLLILCGVSSGCRAIYPGRTPCGPKPCVAANTPREQAKVILPDYLIEPPDILQIEAINLVPKSPYELRVFDVVSISSTGLTPDPAEVGPIDGDYTVQPDGMIQLGHSIGAFQAAGLTRTRLKEDILEKLRQVYNEPDVWVTLLQIGAQQQIAGEHLVAPDGKVNLGTYGRVSVVGMTMEEAQAAVEAHLSQQIEDPEIVLDVLGYNSKVFYVITQGAGLGDRVVILPARGNEMVLDAIGQIQGLQSNSSTRMWIARPGSNELGGDQILPVDWVAVTQRGDVSTNYQILPGDRLYVSEDKLVALDTMFAKVISPVERVFGVTLLGTSTANRIATYGQNNSGGGGGGGLP